MKSFVKIFMSLILAGAIALTFVACSNSTDETTTAAPADAVSDTAQTDGEEDGQNPVMNFIGKYDNGGTFITVEADGTSGAKFTVEEPMTDTEKYMYTFSGTLDLDTLRVTYSNSTKTVQTIDAAGNIADEKVEYSDGSGMVIFHEDGTLEWRDENEAERMADNYVFEFVNPLIKTV